MKRIFDFQLVQKIYTPYKSSSPNFLYHDRPYAGYTYFLFRDSYFYKNKYSFKYSLDLGVLGPDSKAQDVQAFVHNIYGFDRPLGWDYQIKNALGLNLGFDFLYSFFSSVNGFLDFTYVCSLKAGTVFTEITTGLYSRFNLFKKPLNSLSNSILFDSNLNFDSKNQQKEFFLFLKIQLGYALYDATIQGSFLSPNSPVTFVLDPFLFDLELGIKYSVKRFNFGYSVISYKRSHYEMIEDTSSYGSLKVGYKFN